MINLKKLFLYLVIYILYIFPYIIYSTNFSSNDEYIKKRNIKRSIEETNNFKYDIRNIDEISTNNRKKRDMTIIQYKWTSPIFYYVNYRLNFNTVKKALNLLEEYTCLKFSNPKNLFQIPTGIRFLPSNKCSASLGKIVDKGWLMIYVGKECENTLGIIRLIIRSLGIIYEHCRMDRNFFIKVYEKNIAQSSKEDFQIFKETYIKQIFLPYEYGSLMHFGMYTGSKNKMITLTPKDIHYKHTVGQQDFLTFNNVKALNMHYCSKICKKSIRCYNFGYQNPNNCDKCICIEGFDGIYCESYAKSAAWCGPKELYAKDRPIYFRIQGKKKCFYHILSTRNRQIEIVILKMRMEPTHTQTCSIHRSLEIKFWLDKSVAGARFCFQKYSKIIKSQSNHVILYYRSNDHRSYVYLYFKEASQINIHRE
ncbi:Astacin-like metalloendopeptidase [Strongyloides ratti]|uniref:Metalloendopeptidase n=1 Tax=Strongyloides ratti TaxID=34506 RepID=A0A090N6B5_STRRB|nr:Astacin-like metalloendopeptidase [Strongyloides ratti]CEG06135.1 Astacin-like metalloendopeptidase [Strongyloides ratti]